MSVLEDPTHLMYSNKWQHALMRSDNGDWYLNANYMTPNLRKMDILKPIPNPVWYDTDEICWLRKRWTVREILQLPTFHWRYVRYHPNFVGGRGAIHTRLVKWCHLKDLYPLDTTFVEYVFRRAMDRNIGSRQGIDRGLFAAAMLSAQIRFVACHYGDYWKVFWGMDKKLHKWMFYDLDVVTPAGIATNGGLISEAFARKLFPHYPPKERYYWGGKKLLSKQKDGHDDDVSTDEG